MKTDWQTKKLGEICDILDNLRKPVTARDRVSGPYPYYGATGIQDYVNSYLFDEELILVGEDGARWGEGENTAFSISGKTWVNNHAHVIRPHRNIVIDQWLIHYLNITDLSEFITGATVKKLNQAKLRAIKILLPPLSEQKRIVKILDEKIGKIKEAINLREEAIADTEKILSLTLSEIFTEGKKKGWEEKRLDDKSILKMTSGGTPNRGNKNFYDGSIPWLKSGELQDCMDIIDSEEKITNEAVKKSSAKLFPKGTVLFAMYGATAGKIGILSIEASTNQAVAGMIPVSDKLDNKFLYYFLMKKREEIISKAWGGAQPNLSQTILKTFFIPVPPLSEQKQTVQRCDSVSEKIKQLKELQTSQLSDLKRLEKSLLREAFNGEL